jgi:hypothetical protein
MYYEIKTIHFPHHTAWLQTSSLFYTLIKWIKPKIVKILKVFVISKAKRENYLKSVISFTKKVSVFCPS